MKTKIPLWITLFGGFLSIFGLSVGIMGYFNTEALVKGLTNEQASMMLSGRNIAMAFTMTIALLSRMPHLIGLAFIMRFFTELQDMLAMIKTNATGANPVVVFVGFTVVFLIPEIFAIMRLKKLGDDLEAKLPTQQ